MLTNLPAVQETWVQSLGQKDPLEKGMATHSSILAWRIHGQRSLVGYHPQGRKELNTMERLTHTCMLLITQLKKECYLLRRHKDVYSDSFTDALLLCHALFLSLSFLVFH